MPEQSDLRFRPALYAGAGIAITVALIALVLWIVVPRLSPIARSYTPTAGPQLQSSPAADLAVLRAREDAILRSYGWIDKTAGTVRIPVQRAMELSAKEGGVVK